MTEETGHRRDPLPTASGGVLDAIERISRTASIAAIPVVLAIGGWTIQRQLQNQTVSRDYVQLALTILQSPDQSKVPPELREWAVDLLNDNAPTKLNAKAVANLKSGTVILPSFGFLPSSSLTSDGAAFLLGEGEGPDAEQSDRRALSQVHIAAAAGLQVACLRLACDRRDIDERESTRVPQ